MWINDDGLDFFAAKNGAKNASKSGILGAQSGILGVEKWLFGGRPMAFLPVKSGCNVLNVARATFCETPLLRLNDE